MESSDIALENIQQPSSPTTLNNNINDNDNYTGQSRAFASYKKSDTSETACKFYNPVTESGCRNGSTCRFSHQPQAHNKDWSLSNKKNTHLNPNNRYIEKEYGSGNTKLDVIMNQETSEFPIISRKQVPCKFYDSKTKSGCKFGSTCMFFHDTFSLKFDMTDKKIQKFQRGNLSQHSGENMETRGPSSSGNELVICRDYLSGSGCKFGRLCRYLHNENELKPAAVTRSETKCICSTNHPIFPGLGSEDEHVHRITGPIMDIQQFCSAFYHIEETVECNMKMHCLGIAQNENHIHPSRPTSFDDPLECLRKSVISIAVLHRKNEGHWEYVIRPRLYLSCFEGPLGSHVHAEHYIVNDAVLLNALKKNTGPDKELRLTLYQTYQPCNYSNGHSFSTTASSTTSCTEQLLNFKKKLLDSCRCSLRIKVPYLHRAHWAPDQHKYSLSIKMAQKGIKLLHENGVHLSHFGHEDWKYIISHYCKFDVKKDYQLRGTSEAKYFTSNIVQERARLDEFVHQVITDITR